MPYNLGVWLGSALAKVVTWTADLISKGKEAGQNFVENVKNFINNLPTNINNLLSEALAKVTEWGNNLVTKGKESANNLCDAVINGIKNLPTRIANLGEDIVTGLWNGINNAKDWLKDKINSFANGVVDGFKNTLGIHSPSKVMEEEVGKPIGDGVGKGISESMKYVTRTLIDAQEDMLSEAKIDSFAGKISNYFGDMFTFTTNGVNASNKIKQSTEEINNYEGMALAEYWNSISDAQLTALADNWEKYKNAVQKLSESLYSDELDSALNDLKSNVIANIGTLPIQIYPIGVNTVKGFWNGVNNTEGWLKQKIRQFCQSIINCFMTSFQIRSPSRVMAEIGNYITQGLGVGITDDDSAEKAIDDKVNGILNTANASLSNIKIGTSIDDMVAESPIQKYQLDFNAQIGALNDGFDRLIGLVGDYLPNISDNMNRPLMVDGNNLTTSISRQMDNQLGKMASSKNRGNV